jgi:hypothetical protein
MQGLQMIRMMEMGLMVVVASRKRSLPSMMMNSLSSGMMSIHLLRCQMKPIMMTIRTTTWSLLRRAGNNNE